MSTPGAPIHYGQVWVCRDEVMSPMNYLIVSSNAYTAAFADRPVIAAEVDSRSVYKGTYREPIVDTGTALLDRLVWLARTTLQEQVAELHPNRHTTVAARSAN